ncbi:MAG: hypothetical protein ACLFTI_04855 [Anaerolineales bacterium]
MPTRLVGPHRVGDGDQAGYRCPPVGFSRRRHHRLAVILQRPHLSQ